MKHIKFTEMRNFQGVKCERSEEEEDDEEFFFFRTKFREASENFLNTSHLIA